MKEDNHDPNCYKGDNLTCVIVSINSFKSDCIINVHYFGYAIVLCVSVDVDVCVYNGREFVDCVHGVCE